MLSHRASNSLSYHSIRVLQYSLNMNPCQSYEVYELHIATRELRCNRIERQIVYPITPPSKYDKASFKLHLSLSSRCVSFPLSVSTIKHIPQNVVIRLQSM